METHENSYRCPNCGARVYIQYTPAPNKDGVRVKPCYCRKCSFRGEIEEQAQWMKSKHEMPQLPQND
jgi:hypothetical protein